jgi:Flp pilus assembly CpaF family ATPase
MRSSFAGDDERLVTIEDAAELRLNKPHVVALEARPPNVEGKGAVGVREPVRNALRMRPDRIIVGEVRGGEALDMMQAMNTGHEGSLSTAHANLPRRTPSRRTSYLPDQAPAWQAACRPDSHGARCVHGGSRACLRDDLGWHAYRLHGDGRGADRPRLRGVEGGGYT